MADDTLEELQAVLDEQEIERTEDHEERMVDMCTEFDMSAEDLMAKWDAFVYAQSLSVDEPVSDDLLQQFEKFIKSRIAEQQFKEKIRKKAFLSHTTPSRSPNVTAATASQGSFQDMWGTSLEGAVAPNTPLLKKRKLDFVTPSPSPNQRRRSGAGSPLNVFASPAVGKYANRSKSGDIILSFNDEKLGSISGYPPQTSSGRVKIAVPKYEKFRYMNMTLDSAAEALNATLESTLDGIANSDEFKARSDLSGAVAEDTEEKQTAHMSALNIPSQATVYFGGRVMSSNEQKLKDTNVMLEGDFERSRGHRVKLRLGLLPSHRLFPGQIVYGKGVNTEGTAFVVEELMKIPPLPHVSLPLQQAISVNSKLDERPLSIMAAAGPFTTSDNLSFFPLIDFVKSALAVQPDVILLMGPFVPCNHGEVKRDTYPYEERFVQILNDFVLTPLEPLAHTHILVVPHPTDASQVPILPQPPFSVASGELRGDWAQQGRLHFLSNPCQVVINDFSLAVINADVLRHLGAHEISKRERNAPKTNRLATLAAHLIDQQCLYPLVSPLDSNTENVDWTKSSMLQLDNTPDLLITSSQLKHFTADIGHGTVALNIETLAKGQTGGMYGLCTIHSRTQGLDGSEEDAQIPAELASRLRVDITRI